MKRLPSMTKKLEFGSVREWLDAAKKHECDGKALTPCDNPAKLAHGHLCFCGVLFSISAEDFKKTIGEMKPEVQELINESMDSKEGRKALAQACT